MQIAMAVPDNNCVIVAEMSVIRWLWQLPGSRQSVFRPVFPGGGFGRIFRFLSMIIQQSEGLIEVEGYDPPLDGIEGGEGDGVFLDGKPFGGLLDVLEVQH